MTVNQPADGSSISRKRRPIASIAPSSPAPARRFGASGGTPVPSRGAKWRRAMLTLITAHARARLRLGGGEGAATHRRHAERVEVVRGHAGEEEARFAAGLDLGALDIDPADVAAAVERYQVRGAGGLHARDRLEAAHDVVDAARHRAVDLIRLAGHEHPHRGERRRIEAGVGALQIEEAAREERGADQQDDRQRHFGDDQDVAGAAAPRPRRRPDRPRSAVTRLPFTAWMAGVSPKTSPVTTLIAIV